MSGNNTFKQFQITSTSDALLALGVLVTASITNLEKFDEYTTEAMILAKSVEGDLIPGKEYDDIHDKALFRQRELLAIIADEAKDIFSYRTLRKWLMSHDVDGQKLITRALDEDVTKILNELHEVRNWTFHNVQSRLVAEKEVFEHKAQELEKIIGIKPEITPQLNPLIVITHNSYKRDMLDSFISHNLLRHEHFKIILDEMKRDYQDVYDKLKNPQIVANPEYKELVEGCKSAVPVKILEMDEALGMDDMGSSIASLSMAIQKRKYDGSDKSFDAHTIKKAYRFDGKDEEKKGSEKNGSGGVGS